MLQKSTIQLLRFHFSIFLLPVFLFAVSQAPHINLWHTFFIFFILHVLVYPSSNGYNSYMDRDETAIGGLSKPMMPTKELFYLTVIMDAIAIVAGIIVIDLTFAIGLLLYILASRAYSYRGIRLKKYPVIGYLTVIIFQGGFVFALVYYGCNVERSLEVPLVCMLASTFLIGGYYPLTQIYQFEEDEKDGVKTISMLLGKRRTFIFCGIIFSLAATCIWYLSYIHGKDKILYLFLTIMSPVLVYFLWWMNAVWKNPLKADFKNSLQMNIIASGCTCIYFITLLFLR